MIKTHWFSPGFPPRCSRYHPYRTTHPTRWCSGWNQSPGGSVRGRS